MSLVLVFNVLRWAILRICSTMVDFYSASLGDSMNVATDERAITYTPCLPGSGIRTNSVVVLWPTDFDSEGLLIWGRKNPGDLTATVRVSVGQTVSTSNTVTIAIFDWTVGLGFRGFKTFDFSVTPGSREILSKDRPIA